VLALLFQLHRLNRLHLAPQAAEQRMAQPQGHVAAVVIIAHLFGDQLAIVAGTGRGEPLPASFGFALAALRRQHVLLGLPNARHGAAVEIVQQDGQRQGLGMQRQNGQQQTDQGK